jgi:UDP-N-acetylmuramoylalanine--D-glutamate ligase
VWRDDQLVAVDVPFQREAVDGHDSYSGVLASRADVQLPGEHNLRNVAVACALALACGAQPDSIAEGLRTFEGKALRLQRLDEVDGIEIWSDLKATTPEATIAALDALTPRPIVLIAGGEDKGLSYEPLAQAIYENDHVSVVLVPGSASDALVAAIEQLPGAVERIVRVDGLSEGLDVAFELAVSGGVVIVSPAAAGFWSSQLQGATSLRTLVRQRVSAPQEVPGQ